MCSSLLHIYTDVYILRLKILIRGAFRTAATPEAILINF